MFPYREKQFLCGYTILLPYIIINPICEDRSLLLVKDLSIKTYRFAFNKLSTLYVSLFIVFVIYYLTCLLSAVMLFWVGVMAYTVAV